MSLEVPPAIQDRIFKFARTIEHLRANPARNLHVTVLFLGDLGTSDENTVKSLLEEIPKSFAAFGVRLSALAVVESRLRMLVLEPQLVIDIREQC